MVFARALSARTLLDYWRPRRDRVLGRRGAAGALPAIEGYRLLREIGEGRLATVYLAQDPAARLVALKVLRREPGTNDLRTAALVREFALASAIRSRHVVAVFDLLHGDGYSAIAMEYLGGGHLGERMAQGLAPEAALALLRQAALALDALHSNGFVHGDVKPANLLLRAHDELVIADFGLARRLDAVPAPAPAGTVVGTPRYAAPELSQDGAPTAAADVYSLGVVWHEMLCGKPPFPGKTLLEVACQHLMAPVPGLPAPLARFQPLLDRMLEKQAGSRLQDGQAVLGQIDLLGDAPPPRPAPSGGSASRYQR